MRRVVLLNLGAAIVLAALIALSVGRAHEEADKRLSEKNADVRPVNTPLTVADTADLRIEGVATWFACADAAERLEDIAEDLDTIRRGENAALLRAVVLQLRQDMQKLEAETRLYAVDEPMIFGGVKLSR